MTDRIPPPDDREWLTVVEASTYLRVSEGTIRRWADEGILPSWRFGRTRRIPRDGLERIKRDALRKRRRGAPQA